ncbi:MAG: alpha/beta hydrolase [Rhizobiaceae bacterium]
MNSVVAGFSLLFRNVQTAPKNKPAVLVWFVIAIFVSALPAAAFVDPSLVVKIELAEAQGDVDEAVELLNETIDQTEDAQTLEDLRAHLAATLDRAGRFEEAALAWVDLANEMAERLGSLDQSLVTVWNNAALAFEKAGNNQGAAEASAEALAVLVAAGQPEAADDILARLKRLGKSGEGETAEYANEVVAQFDQDVEKSRAAPDDPDSGFTTLRIYYGTDRARTGSDYPSEFYGGERGELEVGSALVSIPRSHKPGQLEKPDLWTFDFRLDPERHIVLQEVNPGSADEVFGMMRQHVDNAGTREAFVFVHGFNVSFNDAARRTAQMAYDMHFDGLPILYSWPSRDSVLSYISDTAVVNLSGRRLTLFLEEIVKNSGATRIHLIAHSMGNRAMTDALELYALRNEGKPAAFDQVLFTAPDLDAGLFAAMAKTIRPVAKRLTLYASNKDWALEVSKRLHGDSPRAGQGGDSILLAPTFDTVDMTMIGEDMLAHSYFANNASALTDIFSLFWRDASPAQRCGMIQKETDSGSLYWHYDPTQCDGDALLSTLSILKRGSVGSVAEARAFVNRYIVSTSIDPKDRNRLLNALGKLFGG